MEKLPEPEVFPMKSTASARWNPAKKEGSISAALGAFKDIAYSIAGRFQGAATGTTPEELIAAAHASCFAMAFGVGLGRAGIDAQSIETIATVEVVPQEGSSPNITESVLKCKVVAPGADPAKVREVAEAEKKHCPVSKALASVKITLDLDIKT
jgi:osmotically inducible protein OsmC